MRFRKGNISHEDHYRNTGRGNQRRKERVVSLIVDDNRWGSDRRAFRREYSDIVKEMIYKPEIKNDIINRTIDVAAQEIGRKAMPKLFGKMMEDGE